MKQPKPVARKITPAYVTKVALLSAVAFVLYMYAKFKLPFMFPAFLEMQFSELPAILAGFSLGPVAGVIVIVIKCLIKFPFSSTGFVGEITDMILGICYVLPAAIVYQKRKTKKSALIGMLIGTLLATGAAVALNRFVSVPFYVRFFFKGNFGAIVGMCSTLYPGLTVDNFYFFYLTAAVLPFNLLRLGIVSLVTFLVYKRLSKILHWEIKTKIKPKKSQPPSNRKTRTNRKCRNSLLPYKFRRPSSSTIPRKKNRFLMKKIIIVGSINTDLVVTVDRIPLIGETVAGKDFFVARGGKGANQAIAASRLGGKVVMCGCVGRDSFGADALKALSDDGVDVRHIRTISDRPTGTAVITVIGGNNSIIVDGGANLCLTERDIDEVLTEAEEGDIYLTQAENPLSVIGYGIQKAKEKGLTVLYNPAPAYVESLPFLSFCDVVLPNETESKILGGKAQLLQFAPVVLTTLGENGFEIASYKEWHSYPALKITPVDTTAAGDTFCGGLAACLACGLTLEKAGLIAGVAASLACTVKGAQPSIPTMDKILPFLK